MNKAKLTNSVLTGGGLSRSQHLNVIIGSSNNGYPKGYVLDANATKQLVGSGGGTPGTQEPSELEKVINVNKFSRTFDKFSNNYRNLDINNVSDEPYTNINMLDNFGRLSEFQNEQLGSGNINSGKVNNSNGYYNIVLNSGAISEGDGSIISSRYFIADVVKHNDSPKLRLKSNINKELNKIIKQKSLLITDKYAFLKQGNEYILKKLSDTNFISRSADSYTRIDDNTVEFNNVYLNKLKDYDRVLCYSVINFSKSSVLFGENLHNIGNNNSIFVGSGLIGLQRPDGKYSANLAIFGRYNSATNNGELACGMFNKSTSTADGGIQTIFSVGSGSDVDVRRNALEVALFKQTDQTYKDKLYINGIGGYNGSNIEDVSVKSIQEVINDLSTNSTTPSTTSFEAADNVLKCINSKPSINSNTKIEDVIKDAFKKGWKNIVLKVTFTKDNIWIVSNQEQFNNGSENKTPIELTFAEIDNSNNNFIKLEDACKLVRHYGVHTYFIINNYYAKNKYVKDDDPYNNRPYVHKFVETLNICGLSKKYSILSKDYRVLIQVISVDALARVGLIYTTKLDQVDMIDELTVQIMDEINIARGANLVNSVPEISFFSCSFDNVKDLSTKVATMLFRKHFELQVNDFDQSTNIQDVKNMSPYITSALCNDVHIGQKLLESNV